MVKDLTPGTTLLSQVRAGLISNGSNLHRWCLENGILYPNARQALIGSWDGLKGAKVRERLIEASGIRRNINGQK
ncbi:hypothetical protein LU632_05825 [Erwinia tracheiphila]|uniref:Uncharacterized protein n=1 Tax=Erwinia tracheiphila TaxID=65700 RepID=A0A345CYW9_9GAMM|nr:hypothetical protein [Erwinia tracheiphila]AXF76821.1 hypothetical protein AV903_13470 [Erwinia tracheiphila]AXF78636.1 hypothetical protein AV903_25835 [Erwinia tracheiphila]UIA91214.1 hypothetical protein LU632_18820 [Erwinia tracheiphila]UIA93091.1 hypothetical protein LU632_05825 [Erwinia tracheiphila]